MVARLLWEQDVGSSSLFTPTIKRVIPSGIALFIFVSKESNPDFLNTSICCLLWATHATAAGGGYRECS